MSDRLHLQVDDNIPELMTQLAGGERMRGRWLSDLVKSMHQTQVKGLGDDLYSLSLSHSGLAGQFKNLDARVSKVEHLVSSITKGDNHG